MFGNRSATGAAGTDQERCTENWPVTETSSSWCSRAFELAPKKGDHESAR